MAYKFTGTTVTRTYRDATNETTSMSVSGDIILADGSNFQAVVAACEATLDAMEAFQEFDTVRVSQTISISTHEATGAVIPTDPNVQREKVVILTLSDNQGNTYQRSIPCADYVVTGVSNQQGDYIDPDLPALVALETAWNNTNMRSPYNVTSGQSIIVAKVGGRNN